jgi:CRP-like cAMP-binding protein
MKAIPKAMRRGVAMLFKVREVAAGTLLLDGSGKAGGIFGVLGGRVRAEMRSEAGDFRMLAVMSQGAIFGGEEPVLGERLGLRYITAGRASILRLPEDVYLRLLEEHPSLHAYIERVAIQRRRLAQEIITAQDLFHG